MNAVVRSQKQKAKAKMKTNRAKTAGEKFSAAVSKKLAARAGNRCSNPDCRKLTSGPAADPGRAVSIGVAAHISAASPGGPRYDAKQSKAERSAVTNGLWLCGNCATLVDRDIVRYTTAELHSWKLAAEAAAARAIAAHSPYRAIAAGEIIEERSIAEVAALRALEEEFGCHVESNVRIAGQTGWMWVDAVVVRGETLVIADLLEYDGEHFQFWRVQHLLELYAEFEFARFESRAVFLVVVSHGPSAGDRKLERQIREMIERAGVEAVLRMYRLHDLRARFGI